MNNKLAAKFCEIFKFPKYNWDGIKINKEFLCEFYLSLGIKEICEDTYYSKSQELGINVDGVPLINCSQNYRWFWNNELKTDFIKFL